MSHTSAEHLYYSPAAISRFTTTENETRHRIFEQLRGTQLPGFAAAHELISAQGSDIIASPLFGAWLDRIGQVQHAREKFDHDEELRRVFYIGNYATYAALASGQEAETRVLIDNGHIMIPEVGRVAISGHDIFADVHIDDGVTITNGRETVRIDPEDFTVPQQQWEPLRYIGPHDFRVALNDIDPNRDIFRYPVAERLSNEDYQHWHDTFCRAWDFIQEHDPEAANIVRATLKALVPAPPEPLTHGKSMAAGAGFGVISINELRDPQRFATHIIYGTRKHLALALRHGMPDLYLPDEHPLTTQPVYPPSREGHGIVPHLLDDSFINIGLTRFFGEVTPRTGPNLRDYAQLSFARWFVESQQNLTSLRASGYVTPGNAGVVAALEKELAAMSDLFERTPEHVRQAVATNVLDRRLSWRMHNITPHAGAVQYLRDVWQRGEPCPPISVSGDLSPSIEAYTHIGQRTRYVLHESRIKDPALFVALQQGRYDAQRFGEPTPGDIAFVSGNVRAARNYFAAAIKKAPNNSEAWAGFALTFEHDTSAATPALLQAPELTAAVYAAIGNANIEPDEIAAWLAQCRVTTAIEHTT